MTSSNNIIFSIYSQCAWYKYVRKHYDHSWQRKLSASCNVDVTHTKYFLLGFKDDSINFVDAAAANDS